MRVVGSAILVLVFSLAAFVQIQQRILRWRAERLLADIREIQMGKSTWADAQHLMHKWGTWGAWEGSCTEKRCDYQIVFEDTFRVMPIVFAPNGHPRMEPQTCCRWLYRPYYLLGGRFAEIAARIEVKDGVIWTKSFDTFINTAPRISLHEPLEYDVLLGTADGLTRYRNGKYGSASLRQEFSVGRPSGCEGCVSINADFSPFADPAIVDRLLDFNLDCLTRSFACKEVSELMPSAWHFYNQRDEISSSTQPEMSYEDRLEDRGRDVQYVAIAEITGTRPIVGSGKQGNRVRFRFVQSLKGGVPPGIEVREYRSLGYFETTLGGDNDIKKLKSGDRVLVLFEVRPDRPEPDRIDNGLYEFADYTQRNFDVIQRGIARDKLADTP